MQKIYTLTPKEFAERICNQMNSRELFEVLKELQLQRPDLFQGVVDLSKPTV